MSTDINIHLDQCRVDDVASVIGKLAGLPSTYGPLQHHPEILICAVAGITVKTTVVPEMVEIDLDGLMVDGSDSHQLFYHFESAGPDGMMGRSLHPKATDFWIAIGYALIDFFGGSLTFEHRGEVYAKPVKNWGKEDDHTFDDFQIALHELEPITIDQIRELQPLAAY